MYWEKTSWYSKLSSNSYKRFTETVCADGVSYIARVGLSFNPFRDDIVEEELLTTATTPKDSADFPLPIGLMAKKEQLLSALALKHDCL
jgi:hypothetical protein